MDINLLIAILFILTLTGCNKTTEDTKEQDPPIMETTQEPTIEVIVEPDIDNYSIELDIDPKTRLLTGIQTIKYSNKTKLPLDTLYINIPANAFSKDAKIQPYFEDEIEKVFYENSINEQMFFNITDLNINNQEQKVIIDENVLVIELSEQLNPNEKVEVNFNFEGNIPNIKHHTGTNDEVLWVSNYLPTFAVLDDFGWHKNISYPAGYPYFSDVANYVVTIKTPIEYSVFGSRQESIITNEDDTSIITTFKENLIRDFSFAIYKTKSVNTYILDTSSNTEIVFYTFSDITETKEKIIEQLATVAAEVVEFYNFAVGTYPYSRLLIFEIDYYNPKGFANSQTIFLDSDTLFNSFSRKDISNLIGKQWFGMIAGNNPVKEPWISEGLVSYMSEYILNNDVKFNKSISNQYLTLSKYINTIESPELSNDLSAYKTQKQFNDIQVLRGKLMFYSLRKKLGYSNFNLFLKDFYTNNVFKNATREDVVTTAENIYNEPLDDFFKNWIDDVFLPAIE